MLKLLTIAAIFLNIGAFPAQCETSAIKALVLLESGIAQPAPEVAEPASLKTTSANPRYWAVVKAQSRGERTALAELGFAIEEIASQTVSGTVSEKSLAKIKSRGVIVSYEQRIEEFRPKAQKDFPQQDAKYHDYARTYSELQSIAGALAGYASLYSVGKSAEGRDIWCLRLNKNAKNDDAASDPGAVVVGNHHAREHISVEIPLRFARWLADNKGKSDVKALLDSRDIYIIPMLNPDGAEYDIRGGQYHYWRKTARKLPSGDLGADINRNYGYLWGQGGSSPDPSADTYRGPSAFSEPETLAMKQLFDRHTNITTCNSYHSYGSVVYYPWSGTYDDIPDAKDLAAFKTIAGKIAALAGYRAEKSSDSYLSTGDMNDWTYAAHHVFSFTTELDGSGFYPGAAAIDKAAPGNIKAMLYMAQISDNPLKAN